MYLKFPNWNFAVLPDKHRHERFLFSEKTLKEAENSRYLQGWDSFVFCIYFVLYFSLLFLFTFLIRFFFFTFHFFLSRQFPIVIKYIMTTKSKNFIISWKQGEVCIFKEIMYFQTINKTKNTIKNKGLLLFIWWRHRSVGSTQGTKIITNQ